MIAIKNESEIKLLRISGKINATLHNIIARAIKPGITTKDLDDIAVAYIKENHAQASFKNYQGFPASICTSINDEVVHGIPSNKKLVDGDIVKVDIGINYQGYHTDSAKTHIVGTNNDVEKLITGTKEALMAGINKTLAGNHLGDISNAIESIANEYQLGVIKELVGHGVGKELHEDPNIPNYGKAGSGPLLKVGMVFAIEPMLNMGSADIIISNDGWTISTQDGKPSAHFEHTVLITENGNEILTGE